MTVAATENITRFNKAYFGYRDTKISPFMAAKMANVLINQLDGQSNETKNVTSQRQSGTIS